MTKKIGIIVPCFNEQENVRDMYEALKRVMETISNYDYEILFIDNDSKDSTAKILKEIAGSDKMVKVIINNRNFGPDLSGMHAFFEVSGDVVIPIACDMQNPPELIPEFIKHWEQGAKVVWGQKTNCDENKLMFAIRTLYYKAIAAMSNIKQYEHVTAWGLFDRDVVEEIRILNDPWPILRNIVPELGYTPVLVPYIQPNRQKGKSSYNFFKYFDTALNSIVHTSKVPLKLAIYTGFICSILSFFVGVYYIAYKLLFWNEVAFGFAPILVGVFFMASLQILFLGILGEYVLAILSRVSFKHYVIEKERINFENQKNCANIN